MSSPITDHPSPDNSRPPAARRHAPRLVVGLAILAAIGLLWPFADWNWWPVVAGVGLLGALYLTRLDVLLRGWAPHLAGLLVVALLLARTGPWAWGFAAGLAALGYGLVRLPRWRVLAVGIGLTAVFGIGYGVSTYRTDTQIAAERTRTDAAQAANVMATAAELVVPSLTNSIAGRDARTACALLGPAAGAQLAAARSAPDCAAAMTALAAQVRDPSAYRSAKLPAGAIVKTPTGATVDGCRLAWPRGEPAGPALGRFELRRHQAERFLIVGYQPCR